LPFFFDESKAYFFGGWSQLQVNLFILLKDDLELEAELQLSVEEVLAELRVRGAHSEVEVGHRQPQLLGALPVGENVSVQADGVVVNGLGNVCVRGSEDGRLRVGNLRLLHGN
jgi:hypothetical protein